jgi:hypothetical protein
LATPLRGRSLNRLLAETPPDDPRRPGWIDAAADLAARLIAAGILFKDLKPSNIVMDAAAGAWLIDTVAVRPCRDQVRLGRMRTVMDRALARDGVERELRDRLAQRLRP